MMSVESLQNGEAIWGIASHTCCFVDGGQRNVAPCFEGVRWVEVHGSCMTSGGAGAELRKVGEGDGFGGGFTRGRVEVSEERARECAVDLTLCPCSDDSGVM